ncbi:hypothetical protein C9374_005251 [Naegleria lovaniensis]|uniref:Uncharacterized protein n=1 Tax=Naegleria lovaniensis TaxID=51637 RepID=A0AA88KNK7_NAELO|nr:uncharacterized protein C9374_005251 [Naegleria lovaniensis]KAG2382671.1 hypothetical protein C9374_005251 [Naegleria lovaniensis]
MESNAPSTQEDDEEEHLSQHHATTTTTIDNQDSWSEILELFQYESEESNSNTTCTEHVMSSTTCTTTTSTTPLSYESSSLSTPLFLPYLAQNLAISLYNFLIENYHPLKMMILSLFRTTPSNSTDMSHDSNVSSQNCPNNNSSVEEDSEEEVTSQQQSHMSLPQHAKRSSFKMTIYQHPEEQKTSSIRLTTTQQVNASAVGSDVFPPRSSNYLHVISPDIPDGICYDRKCLDLQVRLKLPQQVVGTTDTLLLKVDLYSRKSDQLEFKRLETLVTHKIVRAQFSMLNDECKLVLERLKIGYSSRFYGTFKLVYSFICKRNTSGEVQVISQVESNTFTTLSAKTIKALPKP